MKKNFLCEIGCEEIPSSCMLQLKQALAEQAKLLLEQHKLNYKKIETYVSPRRLALSVQQVEAQQKPQKITRKGPSVDAAYDQDGSPSIACLGFLKSCQQTLDSLYVKKTEKGSWVHCDIELPGVQTADLWPKIMQHAIDKLPIPKPMRWGDHAYTFVRPVHWLLMLWGKQVIDCELFGLSASNQSYGHRVHHPEAITLQNANDYIPALREAYVIADFSERQHIIQQQLEKISSAPSGNTLAVVDDQALLEEVTTLVEWPNALVGSFDSKFLQLPREALTSVMRYHQKCFSVAAAENNLAAKFCTICNLNDDPQGLITQGNQKVMHARLEDALFFYQQDLQQNLDEFAQQLQFINFQQQLGSLADKVERIHLIANWLGQQVNVSSDHINQACRMCKSDLVSLMVGEFPELQGHMGYYYALQHGVDPEVAVALRDYYLPRYAEDSLPPTALSGILAIADRIDSIVGIIGIGKTPTGDRDPYALRRQALAIVRIMLQQQLDVDLVQLIEVARASYQYPLDNQHITLQTYDFIIERLRHHYLQSNLPRNLFNAVSAKQPSHLLDFDRRLQAMQAFAQLEQATELSQISKRVGNLLKRANIDPATSFNSKLLQQPAEIQLHKQLQTIKQQVTQHLEQQDYSSALPLLVTLQPDIENFFKHVMVMCDEHALQQNRLQLLNSLYQLLTAIADITTIHDA